MDEVEHVIKSDGRLIITVLIEIGSPACTRIIPVSGWKMTEHRIAH
jgi:hypothetical protein